MGPKDMHGPYLPYLYIHLPLMMHCDIIVGSRGDNLHTGRVFCAAGKLITAPLLRDWGLANRAVGGGLRARGEGGGVLVREFNTTRAWGYGKSEMASFFIQ